MSEWRRILIFTLALCAMLAVWPDSSRAQQVDVTGQIALQGAKAGKKASAHPADLSNVVVWLTSADGHALPKPSAAAPALLIAQENKSFTPHVSAVQVETSVQFPNHDRVLHNVFSMHDGRQFDLGFYEAGSAKSVRFDRLGVSFLFCNIHPEMTAALVVVDSPYFAISDSAGRVSIAGVADGKYILHVWSEQSLPEDLKKLEREITVSSKNPSMGIIALQGNPQYSAKHKNKYGQDYVPPSPGDYGNP